jgi:hypothetical protein
MVLQVWVTQLVYRHLKPAVSAQPLEQTGQRILSTKVSNLLVVSNRIKKPLPQQQLTFKECTQMQSRNKKIHSLENSRKTKRRSEDNSKCGLPLHIREPDHKYLIKAYSGC